MSRLSDKKQKMLQKLGQDAIFEAVVELFREKGLEAITMQNVAEQAGMATGTLYNYFKSKEQILNYVHTMAFKKFYDSAVVITTQGKFVNKLEAFLRHCFNFFLENMGTFIVLEMARLDKQIDNAQIIQWDNKVLDMIRGMIQEGVEGGFYGQIDVEAGAKFIFCIVIGITKMEVTYSSLDPIKDSKLAMSFILPYLTQNK